MLRSAAMSNQGLSQGVSALALLSRASALGSWGNKAGFPVNTTRVTTIIKSFLDDTLDNLHSNRDKSFTFGIPNFFVNFKSQNTRCLLTQS